MHTFATSSANGNRFNADWLSANLYKYSITSLPLVGESGSYRLSIIESVVTYTGQTALTRIPFGPNSFANA